MKKHILCLLAAICLLVACDKEKNKLRSGNKQYNKKEFAKSEEEFRASLSVDSTYKKAEYNLASSSYKQQRGDKLQTAVKYYDSYQNSLRPDDTAANANLNYNLGNTYFQISQLDTVKNTEQCRFYLEKAVDSYKQSLRLNPQDTNAKYNLALAQHLLKDENQKNQNQQQQQDNQQQQQQQQQNKNNQQQQNNNNNNNSNSKSEKKDSKTENQQIKQGEDKNKKQMERMLEALKNSEKQTLNKVKRKDEDNVQKRKIEKDW